jgi:hypothetical protein
MENNFQRHVAEWKEMNQTGRFAEARQYYFEQLFDEVIDDFVKQTSYTATLGSNIDVLFSVLGFTPEPIILAARALNPKHHIIFHDSGVKFNEDNMRYLSKFLPKGFEKIELPKESFATIYDVFKSRMALTSGRNYVINITGGKKSMVAAASIFARDFNASVIYVDYHDYDANLRRPIPGTEYLNVVYSPLRDLPELFHIGLNNASIEDSHRDLHDSNNHVSIDQSQNNSSQNNNKKKLDIPISETKTEISEENGRKDENIIDLLTENNWDSLKNYLDNNLQGPDVRKIQSDITDRITSTKSAKSYWEIVNFLTAYAPSVFLGTIAKADTSSINNLNTGYNSEILDAVIHNAFKCSSKLKYAIDLLMPCRASLTEEQKDFIMSSCKSLTSSDAFYALFKLTRVNLSVSINYLLNINSSASAFTLYKIFSDGQKNGMLNEDSNIESLRPRNVAEYCVKMQKKDSFAFHIASLLIKNRILSKGRIDGILLNAIEQNGYDGFHHYISVREQRIKSEKIASSLTKGNLLNKLRFIKSLDNYYLFIDNDSQSYALLEKSLACKIPSTDIIYQATILDMKIHRGKRVFFVTTKDDLSKNPQPPLINIGALLEISFSQNKNGGWNLVKNNYSRILSMEIVSKPQQIDYRKKQQVKVLQSIDFFTYEVAII